jgi:nitrogen regulatory protein PII
MVTSTAAKEQWQQQYLLLQQCLSLDAVLSEKVSLNNLVEEIIKTVSTGSAADGKIFVKDISEAYDIGSKQTGNPAL